MSKVIGIDLGTTNSVVSIMEGGEPRVITNEEGTRTTPSVVAYTKEGSRLVGNPARRQAVTNPSNTVFSAKRFVGMKYSDIVDEAESMPYKVSESSSGMCDIEIQGEKYAPQQISAQVLLKLKDAAENYLGHEVTEAVITVPAYFNDSQRQATRDAGKIAGLDVKRIINEPTAAALAYGYQKTEGKKIAVYDLGGGTFDVSILDIDEGVVEVLSTNGDTHLGGDDVDKLLIDWLISEFKKDTGVDVSSDSMVIQRLKEAAEKAKIELSSTPQTDINLPFLTADSTGPKHLNVSLSRAGFEKMIDSMVKKTLEPVKKALEDAGVDASKIDEVLLVGGSTRIPLVKKTVEDFFGKSSNSSVNPDEVVALGAAVQGGVFSGEVNDVLLLDVTPLSLGLETMGGVMTRLIERNSTIPCTKSQTFTTAENNQTAVDIKVLQGEREFSKDNKQLGVFKLSGIPPAPRAVPQIEVKFDIDANGIVSVSAKDKATGKSQSIKIEDSGSISAEDIERMVDEAKRHEKEDKRKKEEVEKKNSLESLVFQSENLIKENGDKLPKDSLDSINKEIGNSKQLLESNPTLSDVIRQTELLSSVVQSATKEMYESTKQQENQEETPSTSKDDEDVIDADFEEVK